MKFLRNLFIGATSAIFSVIGTLSLKASSGQCTGVCNTCGGVCIQSMMIMPGIGIIVLLIKKVKKQLRNYTSKYSIGNCYFAQLLMPADRRKL